MGFAYAALARPRARDVVAGVLAGFVDLGTSEDNPPGCMGMQGALACSTAAEPIKAELVRRRAAFEALLAERLRGAQEAGDLPADQTPADLARFVMTVAAGIAVQAASGAPRAALRRAADMALRAWPASA